MAANRPKSPDAIDMLIADHRTVQKLYKEFRKLDRSDEEALIEIVETACAELKIHAIIEEEIFYPAVRSKMGDAGDDLLNEAAVEHEVADGLIDRLGETDPSEPDYAATFAVLCEYVEHHVKEEEKELFPRVRKLHELDLEELGAQMQARRDELLADIDFDEEQELEEEEDAPVRSTESDGDRAHKRAGR